MNVFTFLRKGQKFSKTAIVVASVFLLGMSGVFAMYQRVEIQEFFKEIIQPEKEVEENNSSLNDQSNTYGRAAVMAPCLEDFDCIGKVNLSLGLECTASIEGDMLFVNPTGLDPDTFDITIMEPGGAIRDTNLFTILDIGKTFKVGVSIRGCDNPPCWSDVLIEDKMPPMIICEEDVTIACSMDESDVEAPEAIDNCEATVTMVTSVYTPYPCSDENSAGYLGYYTIKWKATDGYNNDTTCDQIVKVARTDFSGIVWPAPNVNIDCSEVVNGIVTAAQGGVPYLNGSPLYPINEDVCMASLTYTDTLLSNSNACTKFIRREWELIQWTCGAPIINTRSQLIRIVDNTPPVIEAIPDLTVLMTSGECVVSVKLPLAKAKDACQPNLKYEVIYDGGILNTNGPTVQLGEGINTITYNVYDVPCNNIATETFNVVVLDRVPPIAICSPVNVISLTNEGWGVLTAQQVGAYSYDYCGDPVTLEIQRMEVGCEDQTKLWYDEVDFCCEDVGKDLMVAIKVTDVNGNSNICMTRVVVQNKIIPDGSYPEDTVIKCSYLFDRDSLDRVFGAPQIVNTACQNTGQFRETTDFDLNACGTGTIHREWDLIFNGQIVDHGEQNIIVMPDILFDPDTIIWPEAEVITTIDKTDTSFTGSPYIPFVPCNMIMVNVTEDTLFGNSGICFKIIRRWKVINWCSTFPTIPIAEFAQTIIVEDKIGPTITSSTDLVTACSYEATCVASDEYVILKASATDNATAEEDLAWFYEIDLFKDGSVNASGAGDSVYYLAPVGRHKVTFTVYDGCGSSNTTTFDFEVKNCKEPSPKCIGLVTKLMEIPPTGGVPMVEICAKEFDAGSDDICTPADSLKFTFNMAYPVDSLINVPHYFKGMGMLATEQEYLSGDAQRWDPVEKTSCKIFDCDEAPKATIFMTVWDLDKNKGQCQVMVELQGGPCCEDKTRPIITTLDTTRFIKNTSPDCDGPTKVVVSATATDNVPDSLLKWTFFVDYAKNGSIDTMGMGRTVTLSLSVDTHKVTFIVQDTCMNKDTLMFDIVIFNDKEPRAICRALPFDLVLTDPDSTGPMGPMGFVNAKDLDNASTPSFDSCSTDLLYYTFNGSFPVMNKLGVVHYFTGNGVESDSATFVAGNAQKWDPALRSSVLKFDCLDIGTRSITLTVWDSTKKSSSCQTTINISGNCPCGDITKPVISTSDSMRNFCILSPRCDSIQVSLSATATDAPTPAARLSWTYSIDYFKNGSADVSGNATGGTVTVNPLAPIGTHNVRFIVQDTCGNRDTLDYMFKVQNCTPPTCTTRAITITPIDLDGNGPMPAMFELKADTLNAGSTDLCTPTNQLIFTFNGAYPVPGSINAMHFFKGVRQTATEAEYLAGNAQKWDPATRSSRIKIFCPNTRPSLQMTVWDSDTLSSSCNANLTVICQESLCEANDYIGYMVATCHVTNENRNGALGVIYNIRHNATAPTMTNWNLAPISPANWKLDSIGQIFGIALDDSANIYLASSDVYLYPSLQPPGIPTGRIYKARPPLFKAEVFANLPNTGGNFNGIGNIVFDRKHNALFATNLEDGKIYRINANGGGITTYDPFAPDNGTNGIVAQSEQLWGIGINYEGDSTKLYFARLTGATRQMWSLKLTNSGTFPAAGSERLEINGLPGDEPRITDIAFTDNGRSMLWSERGGNVKQTPSVPILIGPHQSIAVRYDRNGSNQWQLAKTLLIGSNVETEYQIGSGAGITGVVYGENAAGGVDFGFKEVGSDSFAINAGLMWVSGNWLHKGNSYTNASRDSLFYGAQAVPFDSVGNVKKDIVIDYNNDGTTFNDKGLIGDLEIFRCGFDSSRTANIADVVGNLSTYKDENIEGVQVIVEGSEDKQEMSNALGAYEVTGLSKGSDYFVRPVKDDDHRNGLNVLDILHMQRHILGVKRLESPEKLIAADVDNDEAISISDLVSLRKLVLGVTNRFEKNTSWRFVDKNFVFAEPTNPWVTPFAEIYDIQNLSGSMNVDFKGIKIGDLDGNAVANSKAVNQRNAGESFFYVKDYNYLADEEFTIPVYAKDATNINALQFQLQLEGIELIDVIAGTIQPQSEDIFVERNKVSLLYTNVNGVNLENDAVLFQIKVKASSKGSIERNMRLADQSIVYDDENGESFARLEIRDGVKDNVGSFNVSQNRPNPWSQTTNISFELSEDNMVKFEVRDLTGKVLISRNISGVKGNNEIVISDQEFKSNGIYIYSLRCGQEVINKKMIFISK
ncbi:MAG: T9SS type A sorting domain-containing protein [Saprospiraceae bacterium]|nr:T9SS type A sorting domain-containing protein [Saprospiraceae bacterium]